MLETQIKTRQYKNIAVAIVKNEEGKVLVTKPINDDDLFDADICWGFPSRLIIPGVSYTEIFAPEVLSRTGFVVEAISLITSEKVHRKGLHLEYVACRIVCRDVSHKKEKEPCYKWISPSKIKEHISGRIHDDILSFLGV